MKREKSIQDYQKAKKFIPGGVNSPVRAFKAVGGDPVFIKKAKGAYLEDIDGNRYLDFIGTWGPSILGHSHPRVVKALKKAVEQGVSFGLPTPIETELAELICKHVPGVEMVRFVNSGTEATMTAIRIARAHTKKDKIIKFEGCYHGHSDGLLVKAGSGGATLGVPTSSGVPTECTKNTIVLSYNDLTSLEKVIEKEEVAGIIVEPVAGNMGVIIPQKEYIQRMRKLCNQNGVLLIMDEVMSGFRVHKQGAQGYFGVKGDLVCLGKIIGGGLPVGAVGGKYELMSLLSPQGEVYQAGTLSGNPLAMTAGLTTIKMYSKEKIMDKIQSLSSVLENGFQSLKNKYSNISFNVLGGMFSLFFTPKTPQNFEEVQDCDLEKFGRFFRYMLNRGLLIPPSQFEANFICAAHTKENIQEYLRKTEEFLKSD